MTKVTSKKSAKAAKGKPQKVEKKKTETKKTTAKETKKAAVKETKKAETKKVVAPTETVPRTKRVVDKESILTDFDSLLGSIETQMNTLREAKAKSPIAIKDLKGLQKQVRQLKTDVNRQIRNKRKTNGERNVNSGFMKPVPISSDMCKFAGWDESELHSRVDVTKFICGYVKEKDLQNPKDRRQILADSKLRSLLKLSASEKEPLTYYSLQRHIQQHFVSA